MRQEEAVGQMGFPYSFETLVWEAGAVVGERSTFQRTLGPGKVDS